MKKIEWQPEVVLIADMKPAEYNPRKRNNKAKKAFAKNREEYGNLEPIVLNLDNTIIGGHQRYYHAIDCGDKEMETFKPNVQLSIEDEKELNLILNSITGRTVIDGLIALNFSQDQLDELGFREFRIPVIKVPDTAVVEAGKQKNKSILAMFFEVKDLVEVKRVLKTIIRDEEGVDGVASAILFLEQYA